MNNAGPMDLPGSLQVKDHLQWIHRSKIWDWNIVIYGPISYPMLTVVASRVATTPRGYVGNSDLHEPLLLVVSSRGRGSRENLQVVCDHPIFLGPKIRCKYKEAHWRPSGLRESTVFTSPGHLGTPPIVSSVAIYMLAGVRSRLPATVLQFTY